jgi:hypothetical protein
MPGKPALRGVSKQEHHKIRQLFWSMLYPMTQRSGMVRVFYSLRKFELLHFLNYTFGNWVQISWQRQITGVTIYMLVDLLVKVNEGAILCSIGFGFPT